MASSSQVFARRASDLRLAYFGNHPSLFSLRVAVGHVLNPKCLDYRDFCGLETLTKYSSGPFYLSSPQSFTSFPPPSNTHTPYVFWMCLEDGYECILTQ